MRDGDEGHGVRGGENESQGLSTEIQSGKIEALEMDGGDGCKTM